jgi:hypothetical protein
MNANVGIAKQNGQEGLTQVLLPCGVVAGPLYVFVGLIQILIRPGFDLTRHELSLMSNGNLGWIQIANFIVTGLLVIASAVGIRQAMHRQDGSWGPVLIGVYGLGLIGAGVFTADPMNGFPPGTPAGAPINPSLHGILHLLSGGVGFLALIAACFVFARRFTALGQRRWAAYSVATGAIFFAAFFGIAAGAQQVGVILTIVNLAFTAAVVLGWAWISALAARLMTDQR